MWIHPADIAVRDLGWLCAVWAAALTGSRLWWVAVGFVGSIFLLDAFRWLSERRGVTRDGA